MVSVPSTMPAAWKKDFRPPRAVVGLAALSGQDGPAQERRRRADEGCQQQGRPQRIVGLGQGKAQRHGGVKPHVAHDVEVAAEGRGSLAAGDRAIEAVDQPVSRMTRSAIS